MGGVVGEGRKRAEREKRKERKKKGRKEKKNNITYNWDLKSKDKIWLKINVKIKMRQVLRSTNMPLFGRVHE